MHTCTTAAQLRVKTWRARLAYLSDDDAPVYHLVLVMLCYLVTVALVVWWHRLRRE